MPAKALRRSRRSPRVAGRRSDRGGLVPAEPQRAPSGRRRIRRVAWLTAPSLLLVLPSCGKVGGGGAECMPAGSAEVCLSRGSNPRLTAKGLEPGSQVIALETREDGSRPDAQVPPGTAGPDGTFPSDGSSLSFLSGSGPLTVLVTVRPRGDKPTTVTFRRT